MSASLRALMEGVKRALITGPKTGRAINDPAYVFASVVAAVAPLRNTSRRRFGRKA